MGKASMTDAEPPEDDSILWNLTNGQWLVWDWKLFVF